MKNIEMPLDIPGVEVENFSINSKGDIIITVNSTVNGTKCKKCGKKIVKFHGYDREICLRHLSVFGNKSYIRIRPKRYQCPYCDNNPTTTQKLSWYNQKSQQTKAYEDHVLLSIINSTIEDVSIKEGLGYEAIMGIINRYIGHKTNWDLIKKIYILGIDEISLKKGHKDFVTIVTGRIEERVVLLGVLKDRKKSTVKEFLEKMPKRVKKRVVAICSDMYEGFINAAREVFGEKIIIVDRFHVAKMYRKCLDNLRKKELKRLKNELSEEEYKKLKGAMWILRKAKEKLTDENLAVMELLFNYSPSLAIAYKLCNDLTAIFNKNYSKWRAKRRIKSWIKEVGKSGLNCFENFISTLEKWLNEITNYFKHRYNSGFVEGLNNKIKVIKRRCYGITNINHLYQRIYLDLEGYKRFAYF